MKNKILLGISVAILLVAGLVGAQYTAKVHSDGPDKLVVESGGEIELLSGATLEVQSGANFSVAGVRYAGGLATTVAASDTIASGLTTVTACVCSLDSDPGDDPFLASCDVGNQSGSPAAGSFYLKTWKHNGTDPTPSAASTFSKSVAWFCKGT